MDIADPTSHPNWLILPNGTTSSGGSEGDRFEEGKNILTWNKSIVLSPNVKLELFYNEGLEYVISSSTSNDGSHQ